MNKTMLSRKELSERWGVNGGTIDNYVREGIIRKNKIGKFTIACIEAVEFDGTDTLIMKKDREIRELRAQILEYRSVIEKVNGLTSI